MMQHIATLKRSTRHSLSRRRDHQFLHVIPENTGPRVATSKGCAIYARHQPSLRSLTAEAHFAAVNLPSTPNNQSSLQCEKFRTHDAPAGSLAIQPANVEGPPVWSHFKESLIIVIKPASLLELAAKELDLGDVTLQPPALGTVDFQALHIAELLKVELVRQEEAIELYVDSLVTIFALHLLRNYVGAHTSPRPRSGLSLGDAKRVREFLDENFTRKLSIAELADIAGLSPFYFIRAFNKTFGQSPHQYILNLRLNFAEKLLLEGNIKIAEIAYLAGFSSQSHLTAAMKRSRKETPADIRRRGKDL